MITSNIGKIFLDAYNEKYGTSYDVTVSANRYHCSA